MGLFAFTKRGKGAVQACRANALTADIFAACPRDRHDAQMWSEVAKGWRDQANVNDGPDLRDRKPEADLQEPALGQAEPAVR